MKLKYLLTLFVISLIGFCQSKKIDGRITDGYANQIEKVPYLVYITNNGRHLCGGSLVAPNIVLTAAHCFRYDPKHLAVVAGTSFWNGAGIKRNVTQKFLPSDFDLMTFDNDYALLKLASPIEDEHIKTIGLCSKSVEVGSNATISGWGATETDSEHQNQMRTIDTHIISKDKCDQYLEHQFGHIDRDIMICTERSTKDTCHGDSGGPLVVDGELCGIVSWGSKLCGNPDFPAVYTDVYGLRDKIKSAIATF